MALDIASYRPAQEDVAGGLHHPLALHHALTMIGVAALGQVVLQHGGRGLLHLQEKRIL